MLKAGVGLEAPLVDPSNSSEFQSWRRAKSRWSEPATHVTIKPLTQVEPPDAKVATL
jgi:hypothetical protein